jgi:hypothetical protein
LLGCLDQGSTHGLDLSNASAHFNGEIDGEIPRVIGREIFKHPLRIGCPLVSVKWF